MNIINFVRQCEPREPERLSPQVLYETTLSQARFLRKQGLTCTWLLQFDALIDPQYQRLMREEMERGCEVGGWLEVPQPLAEAAGLEWRSTVPWDYHAQVDFTIGYQPEERERIAAAYMERFRKVFGHYPTAVGSWYIDGHTLDYLSRRYGIVASVNCRDQVGTDGYTLWGGYWTGGYYPSRRNAYMPAQSRRYQVDVPVFRMLGSDPVYQYDAGVGHGVWQRVVTLEPSCTEGGASAEWLDWYFRAFTDDPALALTYAQVGQENPFPWSLVANGYRKQASRLQALRDEGKLRLETLSETGRWFRSHYRTTPPSATSALRDYGTHRRRTLWFNSRYFRANLLWHNGTLAFRDLHIFDERYPSPYIDTPCTTHDFRIFTLPIVDGNLWSRPDHLAGLRLCDASGTPLQGYEPVITTGRDEVCVQWPLCNGHSVTLRLAESTIDITHSSSNAAWCMELDVAPGILLPYTAISRHELRATQDGFDYRLRCTRGSFTDLHAAAGHIFRLSPQAGKIRMTVR
ncbi:MAG: hypothetical protein K5945_06950 [Bacteroidaceae bacterium]|nr:hypothetical protein [Bacteroidaceae bacterium]